MNPSNEYQQEEYAEAYIKIAGGIPHRAEGERVVLELLPDKLGRVLDLGTGDGRLLAIIKEHKEIKEGVATDFSPTMVQHARARFAGDDSVQVIQHDFNDPLPEMGSFDAIISCFAIHHVEDDRKMSLYREIYERLNKGGVICNLEHVTSPTKKLEEDFYQVMGLTAADADPSNCCAPVDVQLSWLREIGFEDVDCFWKWRELALLAGTK